ncbi:fec operon regulator FecR [compost metagenome]
MEDKQTQLAILFQKLADGSASAEEIEHYYQLVQEPELETKIKALMLRELSDAVIVAEESQERIDQVYFEVQQAVWIEEAKHMPVLNKIWLRIAIAAAIAVMVFGAGLFYYNLKNKQQGNQFTYENDIVPGRNGATLTLANGKKIRLADAVNGKLAEEAGVRITKSEDGQLVYEVNGSDSEPNQINTLSTAKGETYKVLLPDGSLIYLNAASSLTYATSLVERGKRVVRLRGEGYFEISKDKEHPFVVETDQQRVEVLGTHFNINAYEDEPAIATTLLEGSVNVSEKGKSQILKPGEQALNMNNRMQVRPVNAESFIDWKNGDFYLNNLDFRTAMRKIARWYDLEVIYDDSVQEDIQSTGYISRSSKLSSILRLIEKSGQVHFKIEGKKLYVSN